MGTPDASQGPVSAAAPARALSRGASFKEALEQAQAQFVRHLAPINEAAEHAVDEMSVFLDPGALDEVLQQQEQAAKPAQPGTASAGDQAAEQAQQQEEKLEHVGGSLINPQKIMLKDKLAFVIGVSNVALTAFWVGRFPSTYHIFWLVKDLVLFSLRWLVYKQKGMHYMMLEYCYAANLLGFFYLFFRPQSAFLRKFSFAVMSGPLMWSIVAMRNSLVFHDGDKITTLMMHASPAISAWCMRWYPKTSWTAGMTPQQLAAWNSASWFDMAVSPALLNVAWVTVYYLVIFVVVNSRIQARGYQNMFTAMVLRPRARKSALASLVLSVPGPLQPLLYLGIHTFASWVSLLPTKFWFDSYWAHTAVLLGILLWATWNGANFYFRVFAKKLMQEQQDAAAAGKGGEQGAAAASSAAGAKKTE